MRVLHFEDSGLHLRTPVRQVLLDGQTGQTHRSDQCSSTARLVKPTDQTGPMLLHLRLRFFGLGFVEQPRNPMVFW
jgi:hypothetical protein